MSDTPSAPGMRRTDSVLVFLCGLLIGLLAVGWYQEFRLQEVRLADAGRRHAELLLDLSITGEALRASVPDPRERALAGAEAHTRVMDRLKRAEGRK